MPIITIIIFRRTSSQLTWLPNSNSLASFSLSYLNSLGVVSLICVKVLGLPAPNHDIFFGQLYRVILRIIQIGFVGWFFAAQLISLLSLKTWQNLGILTHFFLVTLYRQDACDTLLNHLVAVASVIFDHQVANLHYWQTFIIKETPWLNIFRKHKT